MAAKVSQSSVMSTTSHEPSSSHTTMLDNDLPRVVVENLHVSNEFKSSVPITISLASLSSSTQFTSRSCCDIERLLMQEMPNEEDQLPMSRVSSIGVSQTLPCSDWGFDLLVLRQPSVLPAAPTTIDMFSSAQTRKKRKLDEDSPSKVAASLKFFVINVKPGSIAFDALLKDGDEIVEWMGEEITSLRQFYYGISKCPTLWLTLRRLESSFEKKQRLTIEQYLQQKNCDNDHQKEIYKSIFSITTNDSVNTLNIQNYSLLQNNPSITSTDSSNRAVAIDTNAKRAKATNVTECISVVNINEETKQSQISSDNNKNHKVLPMPTCTYLTSSSSSCSSSTFSESNSTCSSSIATNISTIAANCNPSAATLGSERSKRYPKLLETIASSNDGKINSKEECSVITPVQLPLIPPLDESIFSLPIDDKNLPRSWTKASSGYIHIESGIRVYNSRQMNRVLQLLFYYAPNTSSHSGTNAMSVQEAVKRTRNEYKEYKVRLAANNSEPFTATLTAAVVTATAANSKEVEVTHKSTHFHFDVQDNPRGWLRFCDNKKGNPSIYWKHCLTQRKVKDPSIMPRVLQLLEEQCSGKSITVKEAIKKAIEEKDNGLYTVTVVDSSNSGGNGDRTRKHLHTARPVIESRNLSNTRPKPPPSKRYNLNSLPSAWKKVQAEVNAEDGKRKRSYYLHLESGLKVHESRLMPRVLELLEKRQKSSNKNDQEILSVKDAIRIAKDEVVRYNNPIKF